MDYDDVFGAACYFCQKEDWENASLTFIKALPLAPNDEEKGKCCYMSAMSLFKIEKISDDKELYEMMIASFIKSADYGNEDALTFLKTMGFNYTPQKPSSSSAPNSGGSSAMPKPAAQPARTPYPANAGGISEEEFYQNEKMAKQGNADSCFIMGQAYMFNNYEKCEEWLNKATALGNKEAKKLLKEVKKMW